MHYHQNHCIIYSSILSLVSICTKAKGTCLLTDCALGIRRDMTFVFNHIYTQKAVISSQLLRSEACGHLYEKYPYESELVQFCTLCFV